MARTALSLAALAAIIGCQAWSSPSHAGTYGDAPWCAVISVGTGNVEWDCQYASAEACAPMVVAGNRGFCNRNPYWTAAYPGEYPRHHRRRHARPG